jgi:hypothetical protein
MKADDLNVVDHLGPGFYLWMASLECSPPTVS